MVSDSADIANRSLQPKTIWTYTMVCNLFNRWHKMGELKPVNGLDFSDLPLRHPDERQLGFSVSSTCDERKKGGRNRCMGRSRGGLSTKIRALVDAAPNISDKSNRKRRLCFSKARNKIKHIRRAVKRKEKLGTNLTAMLNLNAIWIWLRSNMSTVQPSTSGRRTQTQVRVK